MLKKPYELGHFYTIIEVFYDDETGEIKGWGDAEPLTWDNVEDLERTIKQLQRVIGTAVLEEKEDSLVEITIKQKEKNKDGKTD